MSKLVYHIQSLDTILTTIFVSLGKMILGNSVKRFWEIGNLHTGRGSGGRMKSSCVVPAWVIFIVILHLIVITISRSSQCSTTGVTKAVVCVILSVGWCI